MKMLVCHVEISEELLRSLDDPKSFVDEQIEGMRESAYAALAERGITQ